MNASSLTTTVVLSNDKITFKKFKKNIKLIYQSIKIWYEWILKTLLRRNFNGEP